MIDRASNECERGAAHPFYMRFNQDVGLEAPDCWESTLKTMHMKPSPPLSVCYFFVLIDDNILTGCGSRVLPVIINGLHCCCFFIRTEAD